MSYLCRTSVFLTAFLPMFCDLSFLPFTGRRTSQYQTVRLSYQPVTQPLPPIHRHYLQLVYVYIRLLQTIRSKKCKKVDKKKNIPDIFFLSEFRHSKSRLFCAVKTLYMKFCARKSAEISLKIT